MAWKGVKAGGNYESAVLYQNLKNAHIIIRTLSTKNFFSGHRAEERLQTVERCL
jgi:hypothetical protein